MLTFAILAIIGTAVIVLSLIFDGIFDLIIPDDLFGFPLLLSAGLALTLIGCSGAIAMGAGARGGTIYAIIFVVTIVGLLIFLGLYRLLDSAAKTSDIEESVVGKEFVAVSTTNNIVRGTVRFRGADVEFLAHAPNDGPVLPGDRFTVLSDVRPYIKISRVVES